jgi:precorrin-3B C17-methyltransferase
VGREDEAVTITTLDEAGDAKADMATLVIVGSPETRLITREGRAPLVYTPRTSAEASA